MSGVAFQEAGLSSTCFAIAKIKSLEVLDFSRNSFGELTQTNVVEMFGELPVLHTVSLARSSLPITAVLPVLAALRGKPSPLKLDLSGNNLGTDVNQLSLLANELNALKIHYLDLSETHMGNNGTPFASFRLA